ncbi:MAG: NMD3-related protein [Nanobdellota archaeon]
MKKPILQGYKNIELIYCDNCMSFYYKGKYIPFSDFKKAFSKIIRENISLSVEPKSFDVDESVLDNLEKKKMVLINLVADTENGEVQEQGQMEIKFKKLECPFCTRLKGGYYEGVLQLRNRENSRFEEVSKEIKTRTDSKKLVAISHEKDVKGGIDFYFTDKKYLQRLAEQLYSEFGGQLKESPRLFSLDRQTSKKIYRMNVLLRLSETEPGDIIKYNGELFKVSGLQHNKVSAVSLLTGKKRPINLENIEKVKDADSSQFAIVTKTKPHLEVLNPNNYTSTLLENEPVSDFTDKIKIMEIEGKLYSV